jgi:hypothetical protein
VEAPDAGSVDADQADVIFVGVNAGLGRDLSPRARGAVQPEDSASLRITELGEPQLTIVADRDVAFQLGTSNSDNHYRSVTRSRGAQSEYGNSPACLASVLGAMRLQMVHAAYNNAYPR